MAAPEPVPFFQEIRNAVKEHAKNVIKYIGYKAVLPLIYKWYARKPIDEKLVMFADIRDRGMPDNFLGLYRMCQKNGFRCEVLSGRPFGEQVPRWRRRKEKLKFHFQFIKLFARCRALFLVEYFPLAYIVAPRTGTDVVQLWHACGAMKMFGYSTVEKAWGGPVKKLYPIHNTYTLACVSGQKAVAPFEHGFRCKPGIVQAMGCPRTDIYFDEKAKAAATQKVRSMFPEVRDRKIILYAPTFRGNSVATAHTELNLKFREILSGLSEEYALFVKLHPQTARTDGISETDRVMCQDSLFDVSRELSAEEALCSADILITDYSSIMFEFLLLERPIISYIYDIDDYIRDRGLYYPYEQLAPGPYVFTQEELIEKLQTVSEWFDLKKTRRYREEFMSACDGHSTERIYRYVFGSESRDEGEAVSG